MRKFRVGDRVRIRSWGDMENEFGLCYGFIHCQNGFTPSMAELCGECATIYDINDGVVKLIDWSCPDKRTNWCFSTAMLEHYESEIIPRILDERD